MFQFYFSASLPVSVYTNEDTNIVTGKSVSGTISDQCTVQPTMTKCKCGATDITKTVTNVSFEPDQVLDGSSLFLKLQGVTNGVINDSTTCQFSVTNSSSWACNMGEIKLSTCVDQMPMVLYAHMRDGYQRVRGLYDDYCASTQKEWSAGCNAKQEWDDLTTNSRLELVQSKSNTNTNINSFLEFPVQSTCTNESQNANAHYLLDMTDDSTTRSMFYTLINTDTAKNVHFAETYMDNGTLLVKSFSIRGRFPGCLTADDANPNTESPYLISKATDYIKVGATLSSGTGSFTWIPAMDLKGSGNTYTTQKMYDPTNGPIWDSSDKDLANWPDTNVLRNNVPDIVVRVIFYNPAIFDPTKDLDNLPMLTQDAITNARSTMLQVFQQNTPNLGTDIKCTQLYLKPFERGVAFVEFITTIVYSIMYQFNLNSAAMQALFFDVSYNVYMPKGSKYTITDFTRHIYNHMNYVSINDKADPPTLLDNGKNLDRLIEEEFDSWVNETLVHIDKYLHYPSFCQEASCNPVGSICADSPSSSTIFIDIHVHPMMHANFQTNNQANLDSAMEVYLNNFFQDFTNQKDGGLTILGKTKSYGVLGNVSVQKNNNVYAGPTGQPMKVSCTQQIDTLNLTDSTTNQTYAISYRYRAQVTQMSVGGLIYLLQHNDTFKIQLSTIPTNNNALPEFIMGNFETCLKQNPIDKECIDILCSKKNCPCDFSVVVGIQKTLNPQSDKYMNNSNGPCACLAPFSYPKSSSGGRALNPVGLCFSKACEAINIPTKDPAFCALEGCSRLIQSIHENNLTDNTWYDVFPDKAQGIDVNKLNNTCGTDFTLDVAPTRFDINWYILGGAVCMALAAPLALALDRFGMRQKRSRWAYGFWLAIIIFMLLLAGLLFYMLSGIYKCDNLLYTNTEQAMCYDRLTKSIPLSREACAPHLPLFCQCTGTGTTCTGYVDEKNTYQAQCMADGACAICPNDVRKLDIIHTKQDRKTVPTTWSFLAIGVWCLVAGLVCVTLGSYFKNLGLTMTQRVGILTMVGISLALMGFGGLIAGMNRTQSTTLKINVDAQTQATNSHTDPCK